MVLNKQLFGPIIFVNQRKMKEIMAKNNRINHLKLRILYYKAFKGKSMREVALHYNISRSLLEGWLKGKSKGALREESLNKLVYALADNGVFVRTSDFYGPLEYEYPELPAYIAEDDRLKQAKDKNDPLLIELLKENHLLKEGFWENARKVAEQDQKIKQAEDVNETLLKRISELEQMVKDLEKLIQNG